MKSYEKMLLENRAWAQEKVERNPEYFERMARGQSPEFLWIGCSDSRVPAEDITNSSPGEIFVHRNVANLVVHTDLNLLSVLQFAVEVLGVKHVIVCGHYSCGGVKAAMSNKQLGLINKWLRNIKDTYQIHRQALEAIDDLDARTDLLVELNVREQVLNLAKTSIIQLAWRRHRRPTLHGWVYGLKDGLLKELAMMGPDDPLDPIYRYDLDELE
ncbi:MAG: carbonate dehydratase [Pseudomonadales bacterium]|jgi:carbonic anhydrase|nr:carbonate dehydratase [Pseudomonadales bacterium]